MTKGPDDQGVTRHAPLPWSGPPPRGWRGGMLRGRRASGPIVVKVGGSLLGRPDWPRLLTELVTVVAGQPTAAGGGRSLVVVVGGGAVVDGLRAIDAAAPRDQGLVHQLAIEAMRLTARLVADATGLPFAGAPPCAGGGIVLDVPAWLAGGRGDELPAGWMVTSDSIAAFVAVAHGASLLVAKSAPPPPCPGGIVGLVPLASQGWLDGHFATVAAPLESIGWAAPQPP